MSGSVTKNFGKNAIGGVIAGMEAEFQKLVEQILEQRCFLISHVDISKLNETLDELDPDYHVEKGKITALRSQLVAIDNSLKSMSTSSSKQIFFDAREKSLLNNLQQGTTLPSVKFENLLNSINTGDFSKETDGPANSAALEKTNFWAMCNSLYEVLDRNYFVGVVRTTRLPTSDLDDLYDTGADIASYLNDGLRDAMGSLNCNTPNVVIRHVSNWLKENITTNADTEKTAKVKSDGKGKLKAVSGKNKKASGKNKKASDDKIDNTLPLIDRAVDDRHLIDVPSNDIKYICPGEKIQISEKYIAQIQDIANFIANPPNKMKAAPTLENPGEYQIVERRLSSAEQQISNRSMPNAAVWPLFTYDVESTEFADKTLLGYTAWGVSEELLRSLVYAEWSLGANITTNLDQALKPDLVGKTSEEFGFETLINQLDICEDLLDGVLWRNKTVNLFQPKLPRCSALCHNKTVDLSRHRPPHSTFPTAPYCRGKTLNNSPKISLKSGIRGYAMIYKLDHTDPLTFDGIHELLGLLHAIKNLTSPVWSDEDVLYNGIPTASIQAALGAALVDMGDARLTGIKNLMAITKNTILGYCNSYFSVVAIIDDITKAEKYKKQVKELIKTEEIFSDDTESKKLFSKIELLHRKVLNRFEGFVNTYLIFHKPKSFLKHEYLPMRSVDGKVRKTHTDQRAHLRNHIKDELKIFRPTSKKDQSQMKEDEDDGLEYNRIYDFTGEILHAIQVTFNEDHSFLFDERLMKEYDR